MQNVTDAKASSAKPQRAPRRASERMQEVRQLLKIRRMQDKRQHAKQAPVTGPGKGGRMQEAGHTAKRGAPGERQDECKKQDTRQSEELQDECKKPYSFHEERQDDSTESLASSRLSR